MRFMKRAELELAFGCLLSVGIALSTFHPGGNPRSGLKPGVRLLEGSNVPERVRATLESKCGDCHSDKTRYPIYSYIAPVSWMIERDVREGRISLNLSQWQSYGEEERINALTRIASEVQAMQMPPRNYAMIHPSARLTPEDQTLIYESVKAEGNRIREAMNHRSDHASAVGRMENPMRRSRP
jgi:cytochrome c